MDRMQKFDRLSDLTAFRHETNPVQRNLLGHKMLLNWRGFVIKQLKDPLRKAIIIIGKRFSEKFEIKKGNTAYKNTHTLIDFKDLFLGYEDNLMRDDMWEAAFNIFIGEYEHDPYYHFRFDWLLEQFIIAILEGKWDARPEGFPQRNADQPKHWHPHWKEPAPYGGKYSIIAKMIAHREEINKLLEE